MITMMIIITMIIMITMMIADKDQGHEDDDGDNEFAGKAWRRLIKARVSGETEHQPCHSAQHPIPPILTAY